MPQAMWSSFSKQSTFSLAHAREATVVSLSELSRCVEKAGNFQAPSPQTGLTGFTMVRHGMPACPITVPVNFFRHFSLLLRSCISLVSIPHTVSFAQVANSPFQRHPCTSELQADKDAKATIKQRQAQLVSDRRFTKGAKGEALAQVSAAFHSEREKRCWQNFAFP